MTNVQSRERVLENVLLNAAVSTGVPVLAVAARMPLDVVDVDREVTRLQAAGLLRVAIRDDVKWLSGDTLPSPLVCLGCKSAVGAEQPLCDVCLDALAGTSDVMPQHELLRALAESNHAELALASLAGNCAMVATEIERVMTAWVSRSLVASGQDPGRLGWRPPEFSYPLEWLQRHRAAAERVARRTHNAGAQRSRAAAARVRNTVAAALLLTMVVMGGGYLRVRSARKAVSSAHSAAFFSLLKHEKLLLTVVDQVPGLDLARARQDLTSLKDMDVETRLRRDRLFNRMLLTVWNDRGATPPELPDVQQFESRLTGWIDHYNTRVAEHDGVKSGFPGVLLCKLVHCSDAYPPIVLERGAP